MRISTSSRIKDCVAIIEQDSGSLLFVGSTLGLCHDGADAVRMSHRIEAMSGMTFDAAAPKTPRLVWLWSRDRFQSLSAPAANALAAHVLAAVSRTSFLSPS
jgi:hypothetical protein